MKKISFIVTTLMIFIISSCETNEAIEADDLAEEPELRQEVFQAIINDNELLSDFMDQMMENSNAMHQMMMNEKMMQQMFSQENMQMMQNMQPQMMQMMMDHMLQMAGSDSTLRNNMMNNQDMQRMMQGQPGQGMQ